MSNQSDLFPLGLLKFGNSVHLHSMLSTGELHFSLVSYFRENYEGLSGRFDNYEGTDAIAQHQDIAKFTIGGHDYQVAKDGPPIAFNLSNRMHYTHACCFSIFYNKWTLIDGVRRIFDPLMFDFGESLSIITNIKSLLALVFRAVSASPNILFAQAGIVEYVDLKYHSGVFRKPKEYEYQQEYRIGLLANTDEPIVLQIGSMQDLESGPLDRRDCKNTVDGEMGIFS
jgi:hypothetical protein